MKTKIFTLIVFILVANYSYEQTSKTTLGYAYTDLSNLTSPTAINQNLWPVTDNNYNLGSSSLTWKNFYFKGVIYKGSGKFISAPNSSTYIGIKAGANALGTGNTALGNSALLNTKTGYWLTALGDSALALNDSGYANTAIGYHALLSNVNALYNTATGYLALRYTNADYNTANGSFALSSNVTGDYNTAIGSQAMNENNNGRFNTALGYNSLYNNINGNGNTASGWAALDSNISGSFNTAYGYQSLISNKIGSYNTAIGDSADVTSNNLTNATAIGAHAKVSQSNSLILGGTGANSVNVGIGTSNPIAALDIEGSNPTLEINSTSLSTANSGSDLYIRARQPRTGTPGNLILQDNPLVGGLQFFGGSVGIGTSNPWYGGTNTKVVQLSATNFPQYLLQATNASTNNKVWRMIARNSNIFQIQTLSDSFGIEQTALQANRNGNSISTVSFPNGSIGIGTTNPWSNAGASARIVQLSATNFPQYLLQATGASTNNKVWRMIARNSNIFQIQTLSDSFGIEQTALQINRSGNSISTLFFPSGNIGIGTATPFYKLDVCGTIRAKEVLVQTGWCDYVFDKNYKLRSLNEVESYINANKHLPDVPSATEVEDKGVKVAQMDSILIKKVEELTLYVIDQNKQIQQLQNKVIQLEKGDADKKNQ